MNVLALSRICLLVLSSVLFLDPYVDVHENSMKIPRQKSQLIHGRIVRTHLAHMYAHVRQHFTWRG